MTKTIGKALLEADEEGLVILQCDRCKSRFKMECSYLNDELEDNDICCPICGISEKLNTFWPEEVVEEAKKIAIAEAERMLVEALKGIKSKHIKIETKPVQRVDTDIAFKNKDYDMLQVRVKCCDKTIGLMSSDITADFLLPVLCENYKMRDYSSEEIQDISANFRNVARRLSRTDYSQCDANLKRFMSVIDNQELISDFIEQHNIYEFDIKKIIQERDWIGPFEISPVMDEEISLEHQMLKYSLNYFGGDFTRLYGTHIYTSTKSTTNDEMRKFIEHIIDPLIDFISEHLRMCYDRKVREEGKNQPNLVNGITANYSTVVVANSIKGNISNNVDISEEVKSDAIDLINSIKEIISVDGNEAEEGILEVLKQIELDINANNKPKKGFRVALKSICGGSAEVITLINSLMKLFGFA